MDSVAERAVDELCITSVPNLRDVGGHPTRDGRMVRTGLLYRSGALDRLSDADAERLGALGLRRVYDLRGARERALAPDRLPAGATAVSADVLAGWAAGGPARLVAWFDDPAAARAGLGGGRAERLWIDQYRQLVRLSSARIAYRRLFRDIARPGNRPALVHCSGGKDRSGWAAAALLLLLGVSDQVVLADYLRSGWVGDLSEVALLHALIDRGGDPELWRPVLAAEPQYLEAAREEVRVLFGSIEGYFAEGLGLDAPTRGALRRAFLD